MTTPFVLGVNDYLVCSDMMHHWDVDIKSVFTAPLMLSVNDHRCLYALPGCS